MVHLTKKNPIPTDIEGKKSMLLVHKIAIWDVIQSCNMEGSSDNCITDVIPDNLFPRLESVSSKHILTNGYRTYQLYNQYFSQPIRLPVNKVPSTRSANATDGFQKSILC
jgi:G:T/U-mismatch repair DNA glycosylase